MLSGASAQGGLHSANAQAPISPDTQRQIDEADSLTPVIDRLMYQWNFVEAFATATQQLEIRYRTLGPEHANTAQTHHTIGLILYRGGRYERAEGQLRYVLRLRERALGDVHPAVAETLIMWARVQKLLGRRNDAVAALDRARDIVEATVGFDRPLSADLYHAMGSFGRKRIPVEAVESLYRRAVDIRVRHLGELHPVTIDNLTWLAHVVREQGRFAEAATLWQQARDLAALSGIEDLGVLHVINTSLGRMLYRNGDLRGAEALFRQSVQSEDGFSILSPRGFGVRNRLSGWRRLFVQLLLETDRYPEAWETLEQVTGWITESFQLPHQDGEEDESFARRDSLSSEVLANERLMATIDAMEDTEAGEQWDQDEVRLRCLQAESSLMRAESTVRRLAPDRSRSKLEQVQAALNHRTAIIGWLELKEHDAYNGTSGKFTLWAYVIRDRGDVHWLRLGETTKRAESNSWSAPRIEAVRAIRRAAAWPRRASRDTALEQFVQETWEFWFAPLRPYLREVEHLVFNLNDLQVGLPFECLRDATGKYLIDSYVISYLSSATMYARLHERRTAANSSVPRPALVVGDTNFVPSKDSNTSEDADPWAHLDIPSGETLDISVVRSVLDGDAQSLHNLPRLPMSRREALHVASLFEKSTALIGVDASERSLDDLRRDGQLGGYGVIHLACHALIHPHIPERSALVLANISDDSLASPADYDGLVTTREIQLGWKLDADLITLSACQTGRGVASPGDGAIGFHQVLFAAGARSLITSLWKVDDVATALLMERFYEILFGASSEGSTFASVEQSIRKARALRDAKLWLRDVTDDRGRKPFEHPAYWAGFVLVGDPY